MRIRVTGKTLPRKAQSAIERSTDLRISPMVAFELQLLRELGRSTRTLREMLATVGDDHPIAVCDVPFPDVVAAAETLGWTRDPFNRLIVANAIAGGGRLVTQDENIRERCSLAVWN